jgi:hypothetical protein
MGDWSIIVPSGKTNLEDNPSFELGTTGYTGYGTNGFAQSSEQSFIGNYSLKVTYADNDNFVLSGTFTLTNAEYHFSCWLYIPSNYDGTQIEFLQTGFGGASGTKTVDADMSLTDQWQRLVFDVTPSAGDLTGRYYVREKTSSPTVGRYVYLDCFQIELGDETTYIDGDQPGCEWNGAAHASTSTRSAISRAGGIVTDFEDYGFTVSKAVGWGAANHRLTVDEYALLPGGELNSVKLTPRYASLVGLLQMGDDCDIHPERQDLISEILPYAYPTSSTGFQPLKIRYSGAAVEKEIDVHYTAGLEGPDLDSVEDERVSFQFVAPDPFWYGLGDESDALDTNDTETIYMCAGRLRSTGQWNDLGITSDATTYETYDILYASDGTVYFVGYFDDFDGVANRDNVARYTPSTDTWSTVGGAAAFNDVVRAVAEGPDGTVYFGGDFTNAGGDGNADYVCQYDPSTDTVSALAAGGVADVYDLVFGLDGILYIVGSFTDWGDANGDAIVSWDGTAYASLGTGVGSGIFAADISPNGDLYVVGNFANAGGGAAAKIARWDGSAWSSVADDSLDGATNDVAIDQSGRIYVVGSFENASSNADADFVAYTDGQIWNNMGTGASGSISKVKIAPDGKVWVSGATTVGGIDASFGAFWNGASWTGVDLNLQGGFAAVTCISFGNADPVISSNYDVYIGTNQDGTASYISGSATVTYSGTQPTYPTFIVNRSGGTSAKLIQIRNETTGKTLSFDYDLLDGETLTIKLRPQSQKITSSFFGSRPDAILANSDQGEFTLALGDNQITSFVDVAGAPTVTVFCEYRNTYNGLD